MDIVRDTGLRKVLALKVLALGIIFVVSLTSITDVVTDHTRELQLYEPMERANLADVEDVNIPGGPTGHVEARIIRPAGSTGELPVIIYFHGGGWAGGNRYTHDGLVRKLADKANAAIVFVEYSLSPEAKFPVANEEAYHAMKYIAENGKRFNLDASRLAVAGDSAGGNMAAAIAIMAKQRNGPKLAYQVLFYPVTDASFDTPSYQKYASGYQLDRDTVPGYGPRFYPARRIHRYPGDPGGYRPGRRKAAVGVLSRDTGGCT